MEKYKKATVAAMWAYFVISTLSTFFEYSNVLEHRNWYLGSKVVLQISLLFLCLWIQRSPLGVRPNLWAGIHLFASNVQGQYFIPWYIFSFVEMIIAFSFLFPLPKRHFNFLLVFGTLLYLGAALFRQEAVFSWLYKSDSSDLVSVIFSASVIAFLSHHFFTSDRNQREELIRKFGLIGVQTANVVHDVKGMLSTPSLNLSLLKSRLVKAGHGADMIELADEIDWQIKRINDAMTGLNEIVALQTQHREVFQLRDAIYEVSEVLSLSMRQVHLQVDGDLMVHCEKALFKSILLNLLINCVQIFRKRKIISPKIFIQCGPDWIRIEDNGGGFNEDVLKSLAANAFNSFDGTGMGLFLVWSGIQNLGGKVHFLNSTVGARVDIKFPIAPSSLSERILGCKGLSFGP